MRLTRGAMWVEGILVGATAGRIWASDTVAPAIPGVGASVLQTLMGLVVVIGCIAGLAWVVRRFNLNRLGASRYMRVVGGVMVGNRERVVLLDIQDRRLVLGVTPHAVSLLAELPCPEEDDGLATPQPVTPAFAGWLKAALERQRRGTP